MVPTEQRFADLLQIAFPCHSFSHWRGKNPGNSLHLLETPPRFLERSSNSRYSASLPQLKAHESCDHNATIPSQLTEPKSVSEQKGTRAESSDRNDKCFLSLQQTCIFHFLGYMSISQAGISFPGNQTKIFNYRLSYLAEVSWCPNIHMNLF